MAIAIKGIVLLDKNCRGLRGDTRICSMVPISLSRATERAVSIRLTSISGLT